MKRNVNFVYALTLYQPWAVLCLLNEPEKKQPSCFRHEDGNWYAAKSVETRSWPTHITGRVLIHASKKTVDTDDFFYPYVDRLPAMQYGAIIGEVEIITCMPLHDYSTMAVYEGHRDIRIHNTFQQEHLLGDFRANRYGFLMRNPILYEQPIYCHGYQRFWRFKDMDKLPR